MNIEIAVTVRANEIGWNHVYGTENEATDSNVKMAVISGLLAGETPFDVVRVMDHAISLDVDEERWEVLCGTPASDVEVESYVREALTVDGTLDLV